MRLNLAGHEWTVRRAKLRDKWGECDFEKRTITIAPDVRGTLLAETLVHEIYHAAGEQCGHEPAEAVVQAHSALIAQMLAPFLDLAPLRARKRKPGGA